MAYQAALNPKIYLEVKKFEKSIANAGIKIVGVYVFGSYAKGKAQPKSDIDVAVISPNFGRDRQGERVGLMLLSEKIDTAIEPHPFSPEDFDDRYYPLSQEIKKTGIKV